MSTSEKRDNISDYLSYLYIVPTGAGLLQTIEKSKPERYLTTQTWTLRPKGALIWKTAEVTKYLTKLFAAAGSKDVKPTYDKKDNRWNGEAELGPTIFTGTIKEHYINDVLRFLNQASNSKQWSRMEREQQLTALKVVTEMTEWIDTKLERDIIQYPPKEMSDIVQTDMNMKGQTFQMTLRAHRRAADVIRPYLSPFALQVTYPNAKPKA
jgi:hypothetical protein